MGTLKYCSKMILGIAMMSFATLDLASGSGRTSPFSSWLECRCGEVVTLAASLLAMAGFALVLHVAMEDTTDETLPVVPKNKAKGKRWSLIFILPVYLVSILTVVTLIVIYQVVRRTMLYEGMVLPFLRLNRRVTAAAERCWKLIAHVFDFKIPRSIAIARVTLPRPHLRLNRGVTTAVKKWWKPIVCAFGVTFAYSTMIVISRWTALCSVVGDGNLTIQERLLVASVLLPTCVALAFLGYACLEELRQHSFKKKGK